MHKKSIEAAHKLNEDDDDDKSLDGLQGDEKDAQSSATSPGSAAPPLDKEELRSESIAQLRAKAQSYSAKMREAISLSSSQHPTSATSDTDPAAAVVVVAGGGGGGGQPPQAPSRVDTFSSSFDPPTKSDSCDSEPLDPTN